MRSLEISGKNPIEELAVLRARVAELERVNRRLTRSRDAEEDLDRAWAEWERTFDAARDSIMVLDGDFKIVQANLATSRFFGKPLEEIIGQPCWKIVHGTDGPCRECPLKVAQNTRNHEEAELYLSKRDIWIEVSVDPILDDQGHIDRTIQIIRDITERRRAWEREKQYIRELEFLSESATAFAQFPIGADLYGYIAGRLKELVPGAIVTVNSYERELGGLRVRELLGLGGNTEAVIKLMGANPVGKCFEIDDEAREGLARGELVKVPEGIYDLSPGIPKVVCQAIEKLLGLGDVYGMGLSWKGELLGSIIILTRNRDEMSNRSLIETFIRQAAVALQRAEAERALQESEERLKAAIDAASLGTWDWNLTTGHIVWSGHHDRLFGFAPGEFNGRFETFESRIHPDDVDGLRQAVERSLRERVDYAHEYRVMWPDGTMRWIAGRGRYCWDQMGRPMYMLGVVSDVTDRKRAEEAYRSLVDHSLQGLAIFQDGRVAFANQAMAQITGYTVQEMLEMSPEKVQAFVHPDDRELVWHRHEQRLNGKILPERYEIRGIRKNGSACWLEIQASAIEYQGKPAIQAAYVDVTKSRKTEKELRETQERFRLLAETIEDVFWMSTPGIQKMVYVSPGYEKVWGHSCESLYQSPKSFMEIVHPGDRDQLFNAVKECHTLGKTYRCEYRIIPSDGRLRWIFERGFPVFDENGNLRYMTGVCTDITERKRTEEQLRISEEKFYKVFQASPASIMISNLETGKIIDVNQAFEKDFGHSKEEIIGRSSLDIIIWGNLADRSHLIPRYLKQRFLHVPELCSIRKSGHRAIVDAYFTILQIGETDYSIATLLDITERKRAEEMLRKSEGLLKEAQRVAHMGHWELDPKVGVPEWSEEIFHIFGLDPKNDVPSFVDHENHVHPDDWPILDRAVTRASKDGTPFDIQFRIVCPSGQIRWMHAIGTAIKDTQGVVSKLFGTAQDITERKKAEHLLRKERDRAQQYLDIAAVMLVAVDSEQRVGLINKKGCEILGYEEEEILGKNWFDNFLPERVKDEIKAVFEKFVRGQADAPEYFESPVLTRNGQERLIAWHNTVLTDEQGNFVATLRSGEDVTERKRTMKALEQSEEKYRYLFEHARDVIVTFDPNGNITGANKAVEEYGFKREELMGKSLFDFVIEEHRAKAVEDFETIMGGLPLRGEMDVITPKGTITVEYSDNPIIRGKHVVGVQAILTDITNRKKAEKRLHEYQAKLKAMASEVLRAEDRERKRLALGLHDNICQRLVLTKLALESSLSLVSNAKLSAVLRIAAEAIGETIEEADSLTFELSSPILREFGLVVALEKYLAEEVRRKHDIACELESDELAGALSDEIKTCLFRVMRELLTNIVKHARANKIKVSIHKSQGQLRLSVCDDGIGFKPDEINWEVSKKTRFGLFSVREQLEYLGGYLDVESEAGRGTTVRIVVPLTGEITI